MTAGDWPVFSDWIAELDQARACCIANLSLVETAVQAALEHLAVAIHEGHDCHPDPILEFSDDTVEAFERTALELTKNYPLRAMAAMMRCYQGWTHRDADYAFYVSDDGWFGMGEKLNRAAELLDQCDPVALDAPLLAAARHRLLAFMPNAEAQVRAFYETWSSLDPKNQTPHRQHAMMMLPRWFGSDHDLQIAAAQAATNTQAVTGEAAYFTMYRTVLDAWDPNVLSMDETRFSEGASDFLTLRNNDPACVGALVESMGWWSAFGSARGLSKVQKVRRNALSRHFKALARDIIRDRLCAIYPDAWSDGAEGCRLEIVEACRDELDLGYEIVLGEDGASFHKPADPALA